MRLYRDFTNLDDDARGGVVVIGNFDGVHEGHRQVIARARAIAEGLGTPLVVLTFEPHPRQYFRPDAPTFRLTPLRSKTRQLEPLGIDAILALPFDERIAARTAEDFIGDILVGALGAQHVVIGYDFAFGKDRSGNPQTLQKAGARHGFGVTCVEAAVSEDGAEFSSTRVRQLLREGKPAAAAAYLGRPWEVEGHIQHGDKRGRQLGFPTANIDLEGYLLPAFGVYAVRLRMIAIGEKSGALESLLEKIAEFYDSQVNAMIKSMTSLIEPLLICFMGGIVGVVILAVFLPILNIIGNLSGS